MKKLLFVFTLTILTIGLAWADYSVDFEGTNETKTAYASEDVTLSGLSWNMTDALIGTLDNDWKNGDRSARLRGYGTSIMTMLENKTNGLGTLSFYYRRYGTDGQVDWKAEYSVDNGTNWTQIGSDFTAPASDNPSLFSEQVNVSGNVRIRIKRATETGTANKRLNIDDILLTDYLGATPTITVNPETLSGFSYVQGSGPSSTQTFTVQGSNLTANISINVQTSPAQHYEISTSSGGTYGPSLTLTQSGGSVSETTIYVRLKAGLSAGDYNSETITASSSGATSKTVTCSGTVSAPVPNAPTATAATSVSYNKFTANWNSVSGATKYYLDVYKKGVTATDLIISEYVEGSSSNKFIEIYNGTASSIDLSNYKLQLYANGVVSPPTNNVTLSGTLNSGQCIVYKNSQATLTLPTGVTAENNAAVNFNGDDAVALYKISTSSYVDIFGRIGEDPGTAWTSDSYTTLNKTLVRKSSVTSGITTNPSSGFPTLATEWDMYDVDTATYLGSHTMNSGNSYVSGYQNRDVGNVTSYEVSGLEADKTYYYVVRAYNEYGSSANSNEISVTTTSAPPPPTITVSTTELTGFSYIEGSGPSSEKTFTVQGSNLTADISIDAPTDYEISKTSGELFNAEDPLGLTQTGGSVSETTIYVRLKAGLSAGNYNGETITASSSEATSKTVTCSGTVCKTEPSNHCSGFAVANVTPSTLKLTWTDAAKTTPDGYLIKGSSISYADIVAPVDGTSESNSTLVRNVNQGAGNYTFTNLAENTTYYFRIYPYTNSGTNINYKTDGEIPQTFGTTLINQHLSAGDITVIGYQSDTPDKFAILLLKSINEGTEVKFTDNGFNDTGALNTTEGTITWTAPEGGLSRGTVVEFTYDVDTSSWTVDKGTTTSTSSLAFNTDGDQIIVYQGESSIPTFIYALSATLWITSGTITSNTSYIPTGLSADSKTCFAFSSEIDNGHYNKNVFLGIHSDILTEICNEDNWNLSDTVIPFLPWNFHIFDYPPGIPFSENDVNITIIGGYANRGSGYIPDIPNPNATFTGFTFVLDNSTVDWTITMETSAAYGAYYLNGNWNRVQGDGTEIVFNISFAKGRGEVEVPIVLSDQDPTLPVELSAFTANINSQGGITIMWVTQSETGVNGFYVNRAMVNDLAIAVRISPLIPGSNTSQQQVYVFSDKEVYEPGTYYYWLEIQDIDGVVTYYGSRSVTFGGNGSNGTPDIPLVTGIRSIYPNPFNPSATIMYELEQPANLNIEIYNNRGQLVRSFAMGQKEKGRYKLLWDGTDNSGYSCGTGIYFIKMQVGKETFVKKAALVK